MLSKFKKFRIAIMTLLFVILTLTASLAYDLLNNKTEVIDTTVAGSSIYIESDQDVVLFPQDCIIVSWDLQGINSVFVNGRGRTGINTEEFCTTSVSFVVNHQDETTSEFSIRPDILIRDNLFQLRIIAIFVSITAIIGLLGFLGHPRIWLEDTKLFFKEISNFWRHFNTYSRQYRILVLIVFLVGVGIRIFSATREVDFDEAASFFNFSSSFIVSIAQYDLPNNHLLNSYFQYLLRDTFGVNLFYLRLHVLISGIVMMPLMYLLGHALYNRYVALIAMSGIAISPVLIHFSSIGRGYILQASLFLAMLVLLQFIIKRNNYFAWLLFIVATALAFFALPTTVFIYAPVGIWLLLTNTKFDDWLHRNITFVIMTFFAACATLLLYFPTLSRLGITPIVANRYVTSNTGVDVLFSEFFTTASQTLFTWVEHFPMPLVCLLVIACGLGLIIDAQVRDKRQYPLLLVQLVVTAIILLVILQINPYARVWTFLSSLFVLQSAVGLYWVYDKVPETFKNIAQYAFVALFAMSSVVYMMGLYPQVTRHRYETAYNYFVDDLISPDDVRIVSYNPTTEHFRFFMVRDDLPLSFLEFNFNRSEVQPSTMYLVTMGNQTPEEIITVRTTVPFENLTLTQVYEQHLVTIYLIDGFVELE